MGGRYFDNELPYVFTYWCNYPYLQRKLTPGDFLRGEGRFLLITREEIDKKAQDDGKLPISKVDGWSPHSLLKVKISYFATGRCLLEFIHQENMRSRPRTLQEASSESPFLIKCVKCLFTYDAVNTLVYRKVDKQGRTVADFLKNWKC